MEILNNIWTAISTPNEQLVNVLLLPIGFVENCLIFMLIYSLFNLCNLNNKNKILVYIILMTLISFIGILYIPNPYNIFINYISMIILVCFIFKTSLLRSSLSVVSSGLLFNLVGTFILNPYISLFNITAEQLNTIPIYRISYIFLLFIIVFIITLILKFKNLKFTILDGIGKRSKVIIGLNLFFGFITIIVYSVVLFYYVDILPLFITFLSFISFLAYFAVSVYSITRVFKLFLTNQKLETAEEYNKRLSSLNDSIRSFKHDFDNTLTTIGGFIRTNDMEGLKKYYFELEDDSQRVNNLYILNPEVVNNNGIYNLITQKYSKAEEKDIKVNITFLLDLSTLNMKIYEFARILGILLDNAIEASAESDEKIINITFRNDIKNSAQIVTIENSYKDKNVNTEEIFQKGITGKEDHQGLGLWKVKKIVDKNSNVYLFTSKNDKFFSQQLEIYC